jgi:DNA gyrase subunit A
MKAVCDIDELMLITQKGILMRTKVAEIRETGRNAQGVKLIRVDEGDKLVAMAKVDAEEADDTEVKGAAPATDAPPDATPPAPESGNETPPTE